MQVQIYLENGDVVDWRCWTKGVVEIGAIDIVSEIVSRRVGLSTDTLLMISTEKGNW